VVVRDTLSSLGDVVMVSLDTDVNENEELLRRYAEQNGFRWRFALASRELLRDLADQFGTQFLTQPSEPMFLVDRRGDAHLLPFGRKSADALRAAARQYP
jgi:hypothetical protein